MAVLCRLHIGQAFLQVCDVSNFICIGARSYTLYGTETQRSLFIHIKVYIDDTI